LPQIRLHQADSYYMSWRILDGLVKSRKSPSPLTGEGRGEDE
jgi:hypothetical protein